MTEWPKKIDAIGTANRGDATESGLCTLCESSCKGKCEAWMSSMQGRKLLYPRDFGEVTSGSASIVQTGVSYGSLRIQGFNYGAKGMPPGISNTEDDCVFPNVSVETEFGGKHKTVCRVPLLTGALGSTSIAAKYWESFAIGAATVGFPIVIGENVVGVDKAAVIKKGKIHKAPELERRIDSYLRYFDGYGAVLVQLNV